LEKFQSVIFQKIMSFCVKRLDGLDFCSDP
jgi:hypothetical protein